LFPKASKVPLTDTLKGKFAYGPNIVLLNGHEWKSQRKIANPAFHQSAPIKLFGKLTQDLFTAMESMGETVNVSMLMANVALDAIGIAGFGKIVN
jgi:cytochrome P450